MSVVDKSIDEIVIFFLATKFDDALRSVAKKAKNNNGFNKITSRQAEKVMSAGIDAALLANAIIKAVSHMETSTDTQRIDKSVKEGLEHLHLLFDAYFEKYDERLFEVLQERGKQ